jgi:altronate dehydratase large subunit
VTAPPALPAQFAGFRRPNGAAGVRNRLVLLSVCGLNAPQARKLAARLPEAALVSTDFGRGQVGEDAAFHARMLTAFGTHPNTGAALVLAPDATLRRRFEEAIAASGRPCAGVSLQEEGEDAERLLDKAVQAGRHLLDQLARQPREPCPVGDLFLAMECGHSDASSGIVANPLVGDVSDALIAAGGRAVFSETLEWTGAEESLYRRCADPATAERLRALVAARHRIARGAGHDVALGNPGPQNHAGGLTTLEEKSLGAVAKGGTAPIAGALAQGRPPPGAARGLFLMDTPALSPESISSMVAAGAQIVLFTTGHGNPYGSALAPTIKLTANPDTAARLPRQIDFDASPAFTGTAPRTALAGPLLDLVLRVAEGQKPWADRLQECGEAISRLGPSI